MLITGECPHVTVGLDYHRDWVWWVNQASSWFLTAMFLILLVMLIGHVVKTGLRRDRS